MVSGMVHSFESLGTLDGPGIRFVVFLSGCPLRCVYCHNPDTWDKHSGKEMTAEEIVIKAKRYKPYFSGGGGITLSGGEPFMQPEFVSGIMSRCREEGISTCADTGAGIFNSKVREALSHTDLVLLDIKHTEPRKYRELTGGSIETQRAFFDYCKSINMPLWIRRVVFPDTSKEDIYALMEYIQGADVKKIELLPYHTLGISKWEALGLRYKLGRLAPPPEELMKELRGIVGGSEIENTAREIQMSGK